MGTRDTAARVRGVSRCAKNLDCTHTRGTRFGSTAGLTVPMLNARLYRWECDRYVVVSDLCGAPVELLV